MFLLLLPLEGHWIILCFDVTLWQIGVLYVVVMRNLWITSLFFCLIAHFLWVHLLQVFGIHWVMSGSVVVLLFFFGSNGLGNIIPIFGIWFQAV